MIFFYLLVLLVWLVISVTIVLFITAQIIAVFTTDAPFVPIPDGVEYAIVDALGLQNGSVLYDLGCGDARVLRTAMEKYGGVRAVGIEIGFFPYLLARFKSRKYKNIKIKREDIFRTDVSDATHIFLYLYPQVMEKLMPILEKKCRKGTRIVSCDFQDKNRVPDATIPLPQNNNKRGKNLFVYIL